MTQATCFQKAGRTLDRLLLTAFALVLPWTGMAALAAQPPAAPVAETAILSENARDVLAQARSSVLQIKGFFGNNTAQAFHGTGFAVAPGGLVLTNYHVVADHVLYPEKYRLEYRAPDGATGKVVVLAVDVRRDLAVVRAEGFSGPVMTLNETVPAKGARAFAIGFPLDVGLTITEGVSNGRVEDAFGDRIHFSGALNAGMSGGPALDTSRRVIGVNVSAYRFQQLVSFLVPATHARALIESAQRTPLDSASATKVVATQLRAHGAELLARLEGPPPTQVVAGYALPARPAAFIDCQAGGDPTPEQVVQALSISCNAKAGLHVQQGLYTGDIQFAHYVLTSDKLDSWRFAHKLASLTTATGAFGNLRHMGPFSCRNQDIRLQGFDASLMVCVRGYRRFEGLYDVVVRVVSLNGSRRGFASHLDMHGVEFDAAMRFVRRYVEAMQWKP